MTQSQMATTAEEKLRALLRNMTDEELRRFKKYFDEEVYDREHPKLADQRRNP